MAIKNSNIKGQGEALVTPNNGWQVLLTSQAETSSTGLALDLTDDAVSKAIAAEIGSQKVNVPASSLFDVTAAFGKSANGVSIFFYTESASADEDFEFELFAIRDTEIYDNSGTPTDPNIKMGPLQPVIIGGAGIIGTMEKGFDEGVGAYGNAILLADTITGTDTWPTGITITDSAANRLCQVHFDLTGCRYLYLNTYNAASGSGEVDAVGAMISAW